MASVETADRQPAIEANAANHADAIVSSTGRALVPSNSAAFPKLGHICVTGSLPAAPFLTHLLATAQGVPQTRARGRAEPDLAVTVYAERMHRRPAIGRAVRESW